MMRESRSRPNWSVPSRCAQLGGSVIAAKSLEVGLYGAISSAEKPVIATMTTMTMPNAPIGSRRQKCRMACQNERLSSISSAVTSLMMVRPCSEIDMAVPPSGETDAWIEPRIEHIDDEIAEHEDGDGEHDQRLGQRVVLVRD